MDKYHWLKVWKMAQPVNQCLWKHVRVRKFWTRPPTQRRAHQSGPTSSNYRWNGYVERKARNLKPPKLVLSCFSPCLVLVFGFISLQLKGWREHLQEKGTKKSFPKRCEASVNSLRIRKASPPGSQGVGSRKTALITSKPDNLAWPQNQRNVWRHVKWRINVVNNMEARQIELFSGGHSELPQFKPKRTGFTLSTLHVHQNFTLPTFLKPASLHSSATDFWEPFLSTKNHLEISKETDGLQDVRCSTSIVQNAAPFSQQTQRSQAQAHS